MTKRVKLTMLQRKSAFSFPQLHSFQPLFVFKKKIKNIAMNVEPWTCYQGVIIPRDFDTVTSLIVRPHSYLVEDW